MSPEGPVRGLAEDLALRSDEALTDLLLRRPDLASPPPRGTAVLAQRALSAASIALAGDTLDLLALAVIEAVLDTTADSTRHDLIGPVTREQIVSRLGRRARRADVDARISGLVESALLWDSGTGTTRKPEGWLAGVHLAAALPWRGHHLLGPLAGLSTDQLQTRIDAVDGRRRELLVTLASGPALGRSRDAAQTADPSAPVPRLLADDLLARVDEQTVELPPMVGRLLRDEPPLVTATLRPPDLSSTPAGRFSPSDVDSAGGGEALELLRHSAEVLAALGSTPAAVLRSGGLGIRELRRIAKSTGLSVTRVGLIVELLAAARLIDSGFPEPEPARWTGEDVFAPTSAADGWLPQPADRRWMQLATTWLDLPRRPWQIGDTDRDGNALAALSSELFDASAPQSRREILRPLLDAPPAAPVDAETLASVLAWRHPRQLRRWTSRVVGETLREATETGLVAHGSLTTVGRTLLTSSESDSDVALLAAMDVALPTPVDYFLVQADMTVMVPGPMTAELAGEVELVADLESGGAASVYRLSESSIRRALDSGRTGSEILALLTEHSRTPVPQSLTYLVDDVARRHGQLRVGLASSFIRCDDAALLAEVMRSDAAAELSLRALAPTVAVSPAQVRDVIDALRTGGFAPSGEDSSGALIDLRGRGARVPGRAAGGRPAHRRGRIGHGQAAAFVARMRSSDRAEAPPQGSVKASGGGETASALIQLAVRTGRRLRLGYVDAHGAASRHVVTPRAMSAGQLVADEEGGEADLRFSLHRITSVEVL